MEKKTAVEWLYNELSKNNTSTDSVIERINKESSIWEQAKQIEKEQIVEAFYQGACQESDTHGAQNLDMKDAENYYNETFKTK